MIDIQNLYVINIHNVTNLEVSIYLLDHHHNLSHKHTHHLPKSPYTLYIMRIIS